MKMAESSPKQVENTVGKGEIARSEQFLLFPKCFQKALYCRHVKTMACSVKGLRTKVIQHYFISKAHFISVLYNIDSYKQ